jgi:predicted CXXCH cytochrome family protein
LSNFIPGTYVISCTDGSSITVRDGQAGLGIQIGDVHGAAALAAAAYKNSGTYVATLSVLAATADAAGAVTVEFTVSDLLAAPVSGLSLASLSFNIAKLMPKKSGESFNSWEPYIWRAVTAGAGAWNDGSHTAYATASNATAPQAYREPCSTCATPIAGGTLTELSAGHYRYAFATNLAAATVPATSKGPVRAISYTATDRGYRHRVTVMLGGATGPIGSATFDFVPDGSALAGKATRDIIRTETCFQCHGSEFSAHGGDRRSLDACVTCHVPGAVEVRSDASLDAKQLFHRIHMGLDLPSSGGADGIVFGTPQQQADNGNSVWTESGEEKTYWKVGFPAQPHNCMKCHQTPNGQTVADVDNWKSTPSRQACGSCHDDLNFQTGDNHPIPSLAPSGNVQTDDLTCGACHPDALPSTWAGPGEPPVSAPIANAHDMQTRWTHQHTDTPLGDAASDVRNVPEFTESVTMSGASGIPGATNVFVAGDAPVIDVELRDAATSTAIDCTIANNCSRAPAGGTAMGSCTPYACTPTTLALGALPLAGSSLFVHGPRARNYPAFTTSARAVIYAHDPVNTNLLLPGPYDLSAVRSFALVVDGGQNLFGRDPTGGDVTLLGTFSVTFPAPWSASKTYASGARAVVNGNMYAAAVAGVGGTLAPSGTGGAIFETPPWQPSTGYDVGARVLSAGNVYVVGPSATTGASAPSGGPSGISNNVSDGAVTWTYVGAAVKWQYVSPAWATPTAVTQDELVAWLNNAAANPAFVARAIAFKDTALDGAGTVSRLGVRSKGLGGTHAIAGTSTAASDLNKVIFGSDLTVHQPAGSTPSNTLSRILAWQPNHVYVVNDIVYSDTAPAKAYTVVSAGVSAGSGGPIGTASVIADGSVTWKFTNPMWAQTDAKVEYRPTGFRYTLDPILAETPPGTYVVGLEISSRGAFNSAIGNYRAPSVAYFRFQVGTAAEELPVARNCSSCHEAPDTVSALQSYSATSGSYAGLQQGQFRGLVFDPVRHFKMFADNATDVCGSCHDYQPQNPTGDWSGAYPISRRVHAVHRGGELNDPNATVAHADEDPARHWDIAFPRDIRQCESCHVAGTTSGSWLVNPNRLACMGCHDDLATQAHIKMMVFDPSPANPYSGDEIESCANCHATH